MKHFTPFHFLITFPIFWPLLNIYKSRFDVILIDTSHVLIDSNIVALDSSDSILYMISNDPIDLANTKSMMAIFKDVEKDVKVLLSFINICKSSSVE